MRKKNVIWTSENIGYFPLREEEPKMAGNPDFYKILEELKAIHDMKNEDYSSDNNPLGNFEMCELAGIPMWKGIVVRLTDKMARILSFAKKEEFKVKDENLEDTLKDLAVYSILCLIAWRKRNEKGSLPSRTDNRGCTNPPVAQGCCKEAR